MTLNIVLEQFKPVITTILLAITFPSVLSGVASVLGIIYWAYMLKRNIVDVDYNGDWIEFFKSLTKWIQKK